MRDCDSWIPVGLDGRMASNTADGYDAISIDGLSQMNEHVVGQYGGLPYHNRCSQS